MKCAIDFAFLKVSILHAYGVLLGILCRNTKTKTNTNTNTKKKKKRNTLRCDLGKIMKIRSIDFSGEWCYFQNQAFNMVLRNVKLILSHITSHFYRKCKNIWQRLSDRHNLFSLFFLMK